MRGRLARAALPLTPEQVAWDVANAPRHHREKRVRNFAFLVLLAYLAMMAVLYFRWLKSSLYDLVLSGLHVPEYVVVFQATVIWVLVLVYAHSVEGRGRGLDSYRP